MEEMCDLLAAILVGLGRAVGERVEATVDVGVGVAVHPVHLVEHGVRLLRRRATVEIDQPVPEDLFFEDREVGADGVELEGHALSHLSTTPSSASCSSSFSMG